MFCCWLPLGWLRFLPCATVPLCERIPFPIARLSGWLWLWGLFLVATLGPVAPLATVFLFSGSVVAWVGSRSRGRSVFLAARQKLSTGQPLCSYMF